MDLGDLTQLAFVATAVLVLGRVGWAFARLIDRRGLPEPRVPAEVAERLRVLEEEQLSIRHQMAELEERQDFAERALVRGSADPRAPAAQPERVATPH
jgi:hypothetical protein